MRAGVLTSLPDTAVPTRDPRRRVRSAILQATGADHPAISCFLADIFAAAGRAEFRAALEDPGYRPDDRLMLRRGGRIIAHVHLTRRTLQFGSLALPTAGLGWLATAPHCRNQGLGTHLLRAAQQHMAAQGVLVGLLRTRVPLFFRSTGWALCRGPSCSMAGTRAIMARLLDRGLRVGAPRHLHIRPWRRWEHMALARIYRKNLTDSYGPLERSHAYWQWLLRRQAYDQLYVALEGSKDWEVDQSDAAIVGYAAIKGHRILELFASPGRDRVAAELLARACGDAIEHDRHNLALHAPANCRLFSIFQEAGSAVMEAPADEREVCMAYLPDPVRLMEQLGPELQRRAEAAALERPLELGFLVDGAKYQLELHRQGISAAADRLGRSYLRLNVADFTRLLLGQFDYDEALADGRMDASTTLARDVGRILFPRLPWWRPPLDDLL
jgi:predicted N-acetyltransferase YhbS